jgi:hypothetical protein
VELADLYDRVKDGKFFSVRFRKRTDGDIRVMNCRVRPPTKGPGMAYDPAARGLLVVWDIRASGWRMIPAEGIIEIKHHGLRNA